ncbi:MAG: hypothetical protein JO214_02345 [Frankiaceae bacterium]|nr:hypothetical protein [Frankiaceae bacterium]
MGCGCGSARAAVGDTLGFYVILPNGELVPAGVNPDDPDAGAPPFMFQNEARREVTLNGGGTIRRLKRKTAATASA